MCTEFFCSAFLGILEDFAENEDVFIEASFSNSFVLVARCRILVVLYSYKGLIA